MFRWRRPVTLVGGRILTDQGPASSLRFGSRVLALDAPPGKGDEIVDLDGAVVLPGLINAHDHLELNHYGALKPRERYTNVADWIDDLRPLIRNDPRIVRASRQPLRARLFIGGLKNLLSGVTTVAHHNPLYRGLRRAVPIRVVERFGWAHSLGMQEEPVGADGEPGGDVRERYHATPPDAPFLIHIGEGIDARAVGELPRLQASGCVGANTVMVHGVAWSLENWQQVLRAGAGLVWCPASNRFLFGHTARVREFLDWDPTSADHVCLGSDSRLTGARDLLDELHVAATSRVPAEALLRMVTLAAARLLKLPDAGRLRVGGPADLVVIPAAGSGPAEALLHASRRDLQLIVVGGRPMVGAPRMQQLFEARSVRPVPVAIDDQERIAASSLGHAIARCPIDEPGVRCPAGA
jgi:cytosine/adenosine deaminase-related metal-dependent hydrolase